MTKEQQVILSLIRKALNPGVEICIPQNVNWASVIEVASAQGVLGLCFEAVELLPADQRPDMDNLMDWLGQVEYMKTCYEEHKKTIEELALFYQEHDIKMMVLKGYGLSLNYPVPDHRPTGDIDTYLYGRIDEADALVEKERHVKVDRDNQHHSVFNIKGVTVENHRTFSDQHNHKSNLRLEKLYSDLIAKDNGIEIGPNIYTPSARLNAIYLLRHAGEHFATEEITLRHVLDLGTFFSKHSLEVDWDFVLKIYKEESMMPFYNAIATICVRDLGFDAQSFKGYCHNEKLADRVLKDIFKKEEKLPMTMEGITGIDKIKYSIQKSLRWYQNRWKYKMVYKESMWESFWTLALNRIKN